VDRADGLSPIRPRSRFPVDGGLSEGALRALFDAR